MTRIDHADSDLRDEVYRLADAYVHETLSDEMLGRLEELVGDDPTARRHYVDYLHDAYQLHRMAVLSCPASERDDVAMGASLDLGIAPLAPTQEIEGGWPGVVSYFSQLGPLSYLTAAVITGAMLLVGWAYQISHDHDSDVADNSRRSTISGTHELVFVGQITGMKDCRWSKLETATSIGASASVGREYALASGIMEITYTSGARVILEGPCTYKVDSDAGGYLAVGKLTVRVETKGSGFRGQGSEDRGQRSEIRNQKSPIPNPFVITTPTAVVTDLGTEFGVEVDENGDTTSCVFEGRIVVKAGIRGFGDSGIRDSEAYEQELEAGESVRISRVRAGTHQSSSSVDQVRFTHPTQTPKFVRRMPKWTPIEMFNTGVGLKEGDADPHWQIAARSDEPEFQPRPAVVTSVKWPWFMANNPQRSQWLSLSGDLPRVPNGVTYTFRTTFQLDNISDSELPTAILRGGFMADNQVTAIRINGRIVAVPEHGYESPFNKFNTFEITEGIIAGRNVLEIDVKNGTPEEEEKPVSAMALLVELNGYISIGGHSESAAPPKQLSPTGKEDE